MFERDVAEDCQWERRFAALDRLGSQIITPTERYVLDRLFGPDWRKWQAIDAYLKTYYPSLFPTPNIFARFVTRVKKAVEHLRGYRIIHESELYE